MGPGKRILIFLREPSGYTPLVPDYECGIVPGSEQNLAVVEKSLRENSFDLPRNSDRESHQ